MNSANKYQWLGVTISIHVQCPIALNAINALLGQHQDMAAANPAIECTIASASPGWEITWQDNTVTHCRTLAKLLVRLEYRWFMAIQQQHAGALLFVHASALKLGERHILVAGGPDAGKTTLAWQASKDGEEIIGDELIAVDLASKAISGLRRGLKLNQPAAGTIMLDQTSHLLPAAQMRWSRPNWSPLHLIALLSPGAAEPLLRIESAAAAQHLYAHCLNSLSFNNGGMKQVIGLTAALPAIELARREPNEMISRIMKLPLSDHGHVA